MSADFANFGATAIGLAGTAAIVGEEMKMLRHATGGGHKCEHCGMMHKSRMALMRHYKTHHGMKKEHHEPHRTGVTSGKDDYAFDFRI